MKLPQWWHVPNTETGGQPEWELPEVLARPHLALTRKQARQRSSKMSGIVLRGDYSNTASKMAGLKCSKSAKESSHLMLHCVVVRDMTRTNTPRPTRTTPQRHH